MAENETRPVRVCDICGGVDDHPRHVLGGSDPGAFPVVNRDAVRSVMRNADLTDDVKEQAVGDLSDMSSQYRHMDCCRAVGCPTGDCDRVPDLRGSDLVDAIMREG